MKVLAFDTTNNLSIALAEDQRIFSKIVISETGKQAELLIPEIEKILRENKIWYQDLDLICTTQGPGSFTGVRIGITAARALKLATNLPLIMPNSLETLAYKYRNSDKIIFVTIDARMDEFFVASFVSQNGKLLPILEPQIATPENLADLAPKENFLLCGSGKKIVCDLLLKKNLRYETAPEDESIDANLLSLLALEKFTNNKTENTNKDPIYLRSPKISERKK